MFIKINKMVFLMSLLTAISSFGAEFSWIKDSSLIEERKLVVETFREAYREFSLEKLNIEQSQSKYATLEDYVSALFDDDEYALRANSKAHLINVKKENDIIIGYASFDIEQIEDSNKTEAYMRIIAVSPLYQGQGIGRKLVFSILQVQPNISRIYMVVNILNSEAIKFYKKIGFTESGDKHDGFDPELYVGLEKGFS